MIKNPTPNSLNEAHFSVEFELPEQAANEGVTISFEAVGRRDLEPLSFTFGPEFATAGDHSFEMDALNMHSLLGKQVVAARGPGSLLGGVLYRMTVTYVDVVGNRAAVSVVEGVRFDLPTTAATNSLQPLSSPRKELPKPALAGGTNNAAGTTALPTTSVKIRIATFNLEEALDKYATLYKKSRKFCADAVAEQILAEKGDDY